MPVDPLSIVGVTIAVLDQLIKLGARTAELTADIKAFDDDSQKILSDLSYEQSTAKSLESLLFSPSHAYNEKSLFEQLEINVQYQICGYFIEAASILKEGLDLLGNRYDTHQPEEGSSAARGQTGSETSLTGSVTTLVQHASTLSLYAPNSPYFSIAPGTVRRSRSAHSPLRRVRWSLWDKKKLTNIITRYQQCNAKVRDNIQLLVFSSQLGVDRPHLHRLETESGSKQLGYDSKAKMTLIITDDTVGTKSLELLGPGWNGHIDRDAPVEGCFSILQVGSRSYLQETRVYTPQLGGIDTRTKDRTELLAKLLEQPKGQMFRIPHCIGWKYRPHQQQIAFIFEIPTSLAARPISLFRLLGDEDANIELGQKFRLAHGLAECISQLHMVKWVHESFRSENILFFPPIHNDSHTPLEIERQIDYSQPWVLGFELSRPENGFSSGFRDINVARDIYRHPERQGHLQKPFRRLHDIYALGVVMLEIGLWQPARNFEKHNFAYARDPGEIQSLLVRRAEKHLEGKVGGRYKDIVLKCLTGAFDEVVLESQGSNSLEEFKNQVVDTLKQAAESV